ncbi:MAG: hypothetical protein DMD81_06920 [Candidatus Rokuibacteriota bacterium]|nr:MAG: hypothetical protein DMD81_06920 [Candidatus Rokubacteria bacterium]
MRRNLFIAAVVLQFVVLIGWVASLERALASASLIRLDVAPVDPRDLLRGDYVRLRYGISSVPADLFTPPFSGEHWGETVYVVLAARDRAWTAVAASLTRGRVALGPGQRVIIGKIASGSAPTVTVTYGIERLYVPEGKGTLPRGVIQADVALTADGRPFLKRVFVDGRPYP